MDGIDATRSAEFTVAVTPSDTVVLPHVRGRAVRALYIGTGGVIVIEDGAGTVTPHKVTDYQILPVAPHRVHATDTTADDIVAWY